MLDKNVRMHFFISRINLHAEFEYRVCHSKWNISLDIVPLIAPEINTHPSLI